MNIVSPNEIRSFITQTLADKLAARGLSPESLPDDFDLLAEGVIDSMGILEVVQGIQDKFDLSIDLEGMAPEKLTLIGPLAQYVAANAARRP
jgi:acyl carrier protein